MEYDYFVNLSGINKLTVSLLEYRNSFFRSVILVVFICCFKLSVQAQPKVTPELLEIFIKYIEDHALPVSDFLLNTKDLSVFVKTLKLSDQFKMLNSKENYTLFAPTNQAFGQFPTDVIKELFKPENKEKLQSILTYHIVKGKLRASKIIALIDENSEREAQFKAINGLYLTAYYDEDDLFIKDDNGYSIKILQEDILLSNGVVYKIDTVILPQVDNDKEKQEGN